MTFKLILTKEERLARAERARKQALVMLQNDTPTSEMSPNLLAKKLAQFLAATQIPAMAEIAEEKLEQCLAVVDELADEGKGSVTLANALLALASYYEANSAEEQDRTFTEAQLQAMLNAM